MTKVLYLIYREGFAGVLDSTAFTPMNKLREKGCNVSFLLLNPLGFFVRPSCRSRWNRKLAAIKRVFHGDIAVLPSPPSRIRWLWSEENTLRRWIGNHYPAGDNLIIHCRGEQSALLALNARGDRSNIKVVYDMRGIAWSELPPEKSLNNMGEESSEETISSMSLQLYCDAHASVQGCDSMICVSKAMKDYVVMNMDGTPEKMFTVPTCVDLNRFKYSEKLRSLSRDRLKLTDRYVVTFLGSDRWWQRLDLALTAFKQIKAARNNAFFLIITNNPESLESRVTSAGLDKADFRIINVSFDEVPGSLAASDLGLLVRADCDVNRVASPTKFAEYMAMGVPVLISNVIGDYSEMVLELDLGLVIHVGEGAMRASADIESYLNRGPAEIDEQRRRCVKTAEECLSWASNLNTIEKCYRNAVGG